MLETRHEEEVVRLIATTKKYERAPYYLAPEFGSDRKPVYYFMNDSTLSEAEKEKFKEVLNFSEVSDEEGTILLKHLLRLNMSNIRDKAIFYYLKNMPESLYVVAKNKATAVNGKHRFYIENKEIEAKNNIDKMAVKMKALSIANEILSAQSETNDSVSDALRLIGIPVKGLSFSQRQSTLLSEADLNSKNFLAVLDDKYRDYKIFMVKCIEAGILYKLKSGSYAYNNRENIIAMNDHQMVAFLQDRANENLVRMWSDTIKDTRILRAEKVEESKEKTSKK